MNESAPEFNSISYRVWVKRPVFYSLSVSHCCHVNPVLGRALMSEMHNIHVGVLIKAR